jgi:hypothetical protein
LDNTFFYSRLSRPPETEFKKKSAQLRTKFGHLPSGLLEKVQPIKLHKIWTSPIKAAGKSATHKIAQKLDIPYPGCWKKCNP